MFTTFVPHKRQLITMRISLRTFTGELQEINNINKVKNMYKHQLTPEEKAQVQTDLKFELRNDYILHSGRKTKVFTLRNGTRYPAARLIYDSMNGPHRNPARVNGKRVKQSK